MKLIKKILLVGLGAGYNQLAKRYLFKRSAQQMHDALLKALPFVERRGFAIGMLGLIRRITYTSRPVTVGGVTLQHPLILAAGMVKGLGFNSEEEALAAVKTGRNIIPGWRAIPILAGLVEFGSYTRYPRMGNSGVVIWRDETTRSTQNRVGLKNPGAMAAAEFLAKNRAHLPVQFGVNIAVSPGLDSVEQEAEDVVESFQAFLSRDIHPTWFTLNISCPNTEDDTTGYQTENTTRALCSAAIQTLREHQADVPLWVKVSPNLAREQYRVLMRVFSETGVRAVVATNTLPRLAADQSGLMAGIGGGKLYPYALQAVSALMLEKLAHNYRVDVIACGGLHNANSYHAYLAWDIKAVQYWSAFIYRGPLAAAIIESERPTVEEPTPLAGRASIVSD